MNASRLPTARRTRTTGTRRARTAAQAQLVLGRYRLGRRLGAGAFGTVWAAHDERLDREVAVKIVPRERIIDGRFEREARAAARLAHPGIVTLYEATIDDDGAYLVSELVQGGTLAELLDAGRLSDRDIVAIALALCDPLSHAHAQGVVHRDVKPSNVLIPERPTSPAHPAKLTDFGVARVVGGDSLTRTGDVVGTAAYMAPEQAEGRETGAQADLYALALVTYEALTGVNPVRAGTAAARARRLGAYLPPLRRQRRDLPRELGHGIDLALRPRPRERGTLEELREALSVSLPQVQDTPGVVASGWPRAQMLSRRVAVAGDDRRSESADHAIGSDQAPPLPTAWPARALAAAVTTATVAWLAAHLLALSPIAPPAAGLLAGVFVLMLPRIAWLAVITALGATATAQHRPGGALVIVIAALVPVALLPRKGCAWPLAAAAPALGLIGLAGAWPALAARVARTAWRRAALGLTGWVWLVLTAPLVGADLYTKRPKGTPSPEAWTASLQATLHDVLTPILRSGVLAGAPVWALGAILLPWLVNGRSLALDTVLVIAWAATVLAATETAIGLVHRTAALQLPSTAVLGALASAAVALSPALLKAWRAGSDSTGPRTQLP